MSLNYNVFSVKVDTGILEASYNQIAEAYKNGLMILLRQEPEALPEAAGDSVAFDFGVLAGFGIVDDDGANVYGAGFTAWASGDSLSFTATDPDAFMEQTLI